MTSTLEAVVRVVKLHAGYAVAYPRVTKENPSRLEGTPITFSFQVWAGDKPPMKGQCVVLGSVSQFEKGWRALEAQPITISTRN